MAYLACDLMSGGCQEGLRKVGREEVADRHIQYCTQPYQMVGRHTLLRPFVCGDSDRRHAKFYREVLLAQPQCAPFAPDPAAYVLINRGRDSSR